MDTKNTTRLALNLAAYCVYTNKTHDLISARKFTFWDLYLNVASDDLYQKIARKLIFLACVLLE